MEYLEAKYIIDFFPRLITTSEKEALKQHTYHYQLERAKEELFKENFLRRKKYFEEKRGYNERAESLKDFDHGYEYLITQIAQRIIQDAPNEYRLNLCPSCGFIARTPYARQCRTCGFKWHETIAGSFRFDAVLKIEKDNFYLIGDLLKGRLEKGQLIDFTNFQLNILTEIKEVGICTESMNKYKIGLTFLKIEVNSKEEALILKYFTQPGRIIMVLKEEM